MMHSTVKPAGLDLARGPVFSMFFKKKLPASRSGDNGGNFDESIPTLMLRHMLEIRAPWKILGLPVHARIGIATIC